MLRKSLLIIGSIIPYALSACNYECAAYFPSEFAYSALNAGFASFSSSQNFAYTPVSFMKVCENPLQPQASIGDDMEYSFSRNVLIGCGNELHLISANAKSGNIEERAVLGFDSVINSFTVNGALAVVSSGTKIIVVDVTDVSVTQRFEVEIGEQSSRPVFSHSHVYYFGNGHLRSISLEDPNVVAELPVELESYLGYSVIDAKGSVYFCSGNQLIRTNAQLTDATSIELNGECTSLILSNGKDVTVATVVNDGTTEVSYLTDVPKSFRSSTQVKPFSMYEGRIFSMYRSGFTHSSKGEVGLLELSFTQGVKVVVHVLKDYVKGDVVSHFETQSDLSSSAAFTPRSQPLFFDDGELVAFTETHLVKLYSPEIAFQSVKDIAQIPNLMNSQMTPVLLGGNSFVTLTADGILALYGGCARYKFGDEVPKNACPLPDLKESTGMPSWTTIVVGASAVVIVPFTGELLCRRMKVVGKEKENENWTDDEDDEDDDDLSLNDLPPPNQRVIRNRSTGNDVPVALYPQRKK